jgi:hypothetical protein
VVLGELVRQALAEQLDAPVAHVGHEALLAGDPDQVEGHVEPDLAPPLQGVHLAAGEVRGGGQHLEQGLALGLRPREALELVPVLVTVAVGGVQHQLSRRADQLLVQLHGLGRGEADRAEAEAGVVPRRGRGPAGGLGRVDDRVGADLHCRLPVRPSADVI